MIDIHEFEQRSSEELNDFILQRKRDLGDDLVILVHHYQRPDVVAYGDLLGDSLKLARLAAEQSHAKHVLFCGVRFMAEAADILTPDHTNVQLSAPSAGCPMADMADEEQAQKAFDAIVRTTGRPPIPVVYMNSSSELKAFCGRNGGLVCTSSNAEKAVRWAMDQGDTVLFFPDEHLGRNTAKTIGLKPEEIALWDRLSDDGELTDAQIADARLVLWKGFCHVHVSLTEQHVHAVRALSPDASIVVHPECPTEVTALVDGVGSTEYIVQYLKQQPAGSEIYVGTEVHMIERMAAEYSDRIIKPLSPGAVCFNMAKTTPAHIACALAEENLGTWGHINVDAAVASDARKALDRMLEI